MNIIRPFAKKLKNGSGNHVKTCQKIVASVKAARSSKYYKRECKAHSDMAMFSA